ncbi:MAG: hypothetical protein R2839_02975 [Thermomicrobiales bacterium]
MNRSIVIDFTASGSVFMNGVIRLASAPINWGITTPGEDGNPEPDELLDSVEKTGYTGCEIGPFDYFGQSADEINALFARHHLDVVAFWVDVPPRAISEGAPNLAEWRLPAASGHERTISHRERPDN